MADVTVTAANVQPDGAAEILAGTAGATITAGQSVYLDTSVSKYKLADADASATSVAAGIAVNSASDTQPIDILTEGDLTIGGTLVVGTAYYVSTTAGGVAPEADIGSGDFMCFLGIARSAAVLAVKVLSSTTAKP